MSRPGVLLVGREPRVVTFGRGKRLFFYHLTSSIVVTKRTNAPARLNVEYGLQWYGMAWYGMAHYGIGMVLYGMVWYGMVWCGMVWYGSRTRRHHIGYNNLAGSEFCQKNM